MITRRTISLKMLKYVLFTVNCGVPTAETAACHGSGGLERLIAHSDRLESISHGP
jgi:hypothetical protein